MDIGINSTNARKQVGDIFDLYFGPTGPASARRPFEFNRVRTPEPAHTTPYAEGYKSSRLTQDMEVKVPYSVYTPAWREFYNGRQDAFADLLTDPAKAPVALLRVHHEARAAAFSGHSGPNPYTRLRLANAWTSGIAVAVREQEEKRQAEAGVNTLRIPHGGLSFINYTKFKDRFTLHPWMNKPAPPAPPVAPRGVVHHRLDMLNPSVQPGLNITVRSGDKWLKARPGDRLSIYQTNGTESISRAVVISAQKLEPGEEFPWLLLRFNSAPGARSKAGLDAAMTAAYGADWKSKPVVILSFWA